MTKPHLVLVRAEDLKDPKTVDAVLASLGIALAEKDDKPKRVKGESSRTGSNTCKG